MIDFAILAPVPREHLDSALEVLRDHDYVSFGSMKWDLFRQVDDLRTGEDVPVLIYPSHESEEVRTTFEVSWIGWYIGHTDDTMEKRHDEVCGHRPPSTRKYKEDDAYGWAVFWRVTDLQMLPPGSHIAISDIESHVRPGYWRKNSAPYGPELVAYPVWFDSLLWRAESVAARDVDEPPPRIESRVTRVVRDTAVGQRLKQTYGYACQICGTRLPMGGERYYAEVHHIRPLGGEHSGTDQAGNMLVLCPNHHALFDYGVPKFVSATEVEILGTIYNLESRHQLDAHSLDYHNEVIYRPPD
jgi:hypothetical protein